MFAARRLNDGMGAYVANETIRCMNLKGVKVKDAKILLLGITFKENCPDVRNTKIVDIYHTLCPYTKNITVYDPWADALKVKKEYDIDLYQGDMQALKGSFDAVIMCVAHKEFAQFNVRDFLAEYNEGVVYDVKGAVDRTLVDGRL